MSFKSDEISLIKYTFTQKSTYSDNYIRTLINLIPANLNFIMNIQVQVGIVKKTVTPEFAK